MRAAIESRLGNRARELGLDVGRLRRRLVFQRMLRRLEPGEDWVLKGGFLLETRLGQGFRSTKDLDLVIAGERTDEAFVDDLENVLARDPDVDYFRFEVSSIKPLALDDADRGGWRASVSAILDGRVFDRVRLDVVARAAEVAGGTETFTVPSPLPGLGFTDADVVAVDVAQHAAEKLHALCRIYSGNRPSTRVKDLLDVDLMIAAGVLAPMPLRDRLHTVFAVRDGSPPPPQLPDPPASWATDFTALARETSAGATELDHAFARVRAIYRLALGKGEL